MVWKWLGQSEGYARTEHYQETSNADNQEGWRQNDNHHYAENKQAIWRIRLVTIGCEIVVVGHRVEKPGSVQQRPIKLDDQLSDLEPLVSLPEAKWDESEEKFGYKDIVHKYSVELGGLKCAPYIFTIEVD